MGAVNEFVAASARERLAHGRAKALNEVASDPSGARSCDGDPKLGGPSAILEDDPLLMKRMRAYAAMPKEKRPTYDDIAKELKKENKKWSVQKKGKNKGKPWAGKQIYMFLARINASNKLKKMPKPKAPSSSTSATKGKMAATKEKDGRKGGSKGARQKAKLITWSVSKSASALKRKKNAITLPLARSG